MNDKAMVGGKMANLKKGSNQFMKEGGSQDPPSAPLMSFEDAAKKVGVSRGSVIRAKTVIDKGVPELVKAVEGNKIPITTAAKLAKLPAEKQRKALRADRADRILEKVRGWRKAYRLFRVTSNRNKTITAKITHWVINLEKYIPYTSHSQGGEKHF
ncbi:MAG: hypothetical protein AB9903_12510 [Vulcanimicrobiota bacterium]